MTNYKENISLEKWATNMNRQFIKEVIGTYHKEMKHCSASQTMVKFFAVKLGKI